MKIISLFYQLKFCFTLSLLGSLYSYGQNWYVNDAYTKGDIFTFSPGNQNNSGLGPEAPSNSIGIVFSKAKKGDTIYIDKGNYSELNTEGKLLIAAPEGVSVILFSDTIYAKNNFPKDVKATAEEIYILNDKPVSREVYLKSKR